MLGRFDRNSVLQTDLDKDEVLQSLGAIRQRQHRRTGQLIRSITEAKNRGSLTKLDRIPQLSDESIWRNLFQKRQWELVETV